MIVGAIVLFVAIVVTIVVVVSANSVGGATPQDAIDGYISAAQNNDRSKAASYVCEFSRPLMQDAGTGDLFYDGTGQPILSWTIGQVSQSAQVSVDITRRKGRRHESGAQRQLSPPSRRSTVSGLSVDRAVVYTCPPDTV